MNNNLKIFLLVDILILYITGIVLWRNTTSMGMVDWLLILGCEAQVQMLIHFLQEKKK